MKRTSKPNTPTTEDAKGATPVPRLICDFRNKGFTTIPEELVETTTELNLQDNKISSFGTLPKRLKILKMEGNKMSSMMGISQCSSLECIELSHNQISKIEVQLVDIFLLVGRFCLVQVT